MLTVGKFLEVELHTVELPDGRVIPDWPWIITPDYVCVVPVTPSGEYLCFRQPKYAVGGESLATVGGYLEPGEDPLAAAQRELREEMGYAATEWRSLGTYGVDGNRGAGNANLFLALGAYPVEKVQSDDWEEQRLVTLTRAEALDALRRGEFKLLAWATIMSLALISNSR